MSRPSRNGLLFGLILGFGVLAIALLLLTRGGGERREAVVISAPSSAKGPPPDVPVEAPAPPARSEADDRPPPSTVLWPVELALELVEAWELPTEKGVPPLGSGALARLAGTIVGGPGGEGVAATVEFVEGANRGRVLHCQPSGSFGANDLYPGLAIVEVRGPGIIGSRREVILRQGHETLLNLGYGRLGAVHGRVIAGPEGEGVEGARVVLDGQATRTDEEGWFYVDQVCSDWGLIEIEKPGYAALRAKVGVTAGYTIPRGKLVYRLEPATNLTITLRNAIGADEPARVWVLPVETKRERRYPWYRINPVEVIPGTSHEIQGLPEGPVVVRAFHRGAVAAPREAQVSLRRGRSASVEIELQAAPTLSGVVRRGGDPVPYARVRLEAPDRVRATLGYFREGHALLESELLPDWPFAVQDARADRFGRFVLTAWSDVAPARYLRAYSPEGDAWAARLVGPGVESVELELSAESYARSELAVRAPGRHQPLPVRVTIDGSPYDTQLLPVDEPLVVGALASGVWKVQARWQQIEVYSNPELTIQGRAAIELDLPREAIEGQDEEQWLRAGRVYPN